MIDFEVVEQPAAKLGEGPVWDYRTGCFLWVDAFRHGFYTLDSNAPGEARAEPVYHRTGVFTIGITLFGRTGPACVVTEADACGIRVPDVKRHDEQDQRPAGGRVDCPYHLIPPPAGTVPAGKEVGRDSHRFNDVAAIPGGIFLAGVMPWSPDPAPHAPGRGALIAFDSQRRSRLVCGEARLPNGIGYDPATDVVYFTDSLRKMIYRIPAVVIREIVSGLRDPISLTDLPAGVRPFAETTDRPGVPDGLTVASDGSVFSARWGGRCIDRFDGSGRLVQSYPVPMRQPSSLCFGGENLSTVMITSATEHIPGAEREPYDGTTILTDFGVRGLPETALFW